MANFSPFSHHSTGWVGVAASLNSNLCTAPDSVGYNRKNPPVEETQSLDDYPIKIILPPLAMSAKQRITSLHAAAWLTTRYIPPVNSGDIVRVAHHLLKIPLDKTYLDDVRIRPSLLDRSIPAPLKDKLELGAFQTEHTPVVALNRMEAKSPRFLMFV
jgi:hypothetical protein